EPLRSAVRRVLLHEVVRVDAGARHREQLRADIDQAEQDGLLLLELRPVPGHGEEKSASELAGRALDEAEVAREPAELAVRARDAALAHEQPGHPAGHVHAQTREALELLAR